jgi:hypothetical protein
VGKREAFTRPKAGPLQLFTQATTAGVNVERGRTRWIVDGVWRTLGQAGVTKFVMIAQMRMRF